MTVFLSDNGALNAHTYKVSKLAEAYPAAAGHMCDGKRHP